MIASKAHWCAPQKHLPHAWLLLIVDQIRGDLATQLRQRECVHRGMDDHHSPFGKEKKYFYLDSDFFFPY